MKLGFVSAILEDYAYAEHIAGYAQEKGVAISSLAYYPNTMDGNLEKRTAAVGHLKSLIRASAKLGVGMVTTFIGRDQTKTVEENLELVKESIALGMPEDFFSIDLMSAYESLGRILGESVGEDLVNEIFSKFCMGK